MKNYEKLLLANKAWVNERLAIRPDFFTETEKGQSPKFLWIGCSDSRVPAEEVTGTEPGELFVHRNIANLVIHTDFNVLSVLQYAVDVLQVENVIICGHYGCGGIRSAMSNQSFGLINKWLRHIKDIYRFHRDELESIPNFDSRHSRLVELNVFEQVHNLAETSIVQHSWREFGRPTIHGWVYDIGTGYLKPLAMLEPGTKIEDIYMYDFPDLQKD